jgi:drug/metabolite transporter (DMT)-like permease
LHDRLSAPRVAGLVVGFAGVFGLAVGRAGVQPGAAARMTVAVLAVACTGIAYVMYFRLIAHIGPANAIIVTFLVPAFAIAWGALLLNERPTAAMLAGCAVILAGTALATGLLPRSRGIRPA